MKRCFTARSRRLPLYISLPALFGVWWGYVARKDRVVPLDEMDVPPRRSRPIAITGTRPGPGTQRGPGAPPVTWALPAWRCVSGVALHGMGP